MGGLSRIRLDGLANNSVANTNINVLYFYLSIYPKAMAKANESPTDPN